MYIIMNKVGGCNLLEYGPYISEEDAIKEMDRLEAEAKEAGRRVWFRSESGMNMVVESEAHEDSEKWEVSKLMLHHPKL